MKYTEEQISRMLENADSETAASILLKLNQIRSLTALRDELSESNRSMRHVLDELSESTRTIGGIVDDMNDAAARLSQAVKSME